MKRYISTRWMVIVGTIAIITSLLIQNPKEYGDLDLLKTICNIIWIIVVFYLVIRAIQIINLTNKATHHD